MSRRRHRMSRRSSKRSFSRNAMRVSRKNNARPMRGGFRI